MNILELIQSDHRKVENLFSEIENANDDDRVYGYFNQLYKELTLHSHSEEMTLYPAMREYEETEDMIEEAEEEHVEAEELLEEIKSLSPGSTEFKAKIRELKEAVMHHVEEEETEIFPAVSECMSDEEMQELAEEFQEVKSKLQSDVTDAVSR